VDDSHSEGEYGMMLRHRCTMCGTEWGCNNRNCNGLLKDKPCRNCRLMIWRYWKPQDIRINENHFPSDVLD
jgi:hypothetical protein